MIFAINIPRKVNLILVISAVGDLADIPKITEPGWETRTRRGALLRPYRDQWQCGSARDERDLKRGWKTAGND